MIEFLLKFYARHFPVRRGKYRIIDRFGGRPDADGGFVRRARLVYGGYMMDCDLRKQLQRQFYYFGTYFLEERVLEAWSRYASKAKVVLDVGANAGIYSLAAAAAHPVSEIHAFEPTPEIAAHLNKTAVISGLVDRLHVHAVAVGDRPGTIFLNRFSGDNADNEGMNFVSAQSRAASSIEVPMVSLDEFCRVTGLQSIDLLKVDVQGNEPAVFDGARGLIARGAIGTIFFELNWNKKHPAHCPARKAVDTLSCAGYRFVDPNGRLNSREAGPWLEALSDVIAVR
jgi:FkbM family methyltransferase